MKKDIEKAIREVLVIENKQSLHIAVDRICDLFDVSKAKAELLGKFYVYLSEQAIIHDTCRNDAEMEEALRKFNL